jgi:hypothetical protein
MLFNNFLSFIWYKLINLIKNTIMVKTSKIVNIITRRQKAPQQEDKKEIQERYKASWQQIQSNINSRQADIKEYQQAIAEHTPELLDTLTQHTAYSAYLNQIVELQNDLNELIDLAKRQSVTSEEALEQYEKLIQQESAEIEKKSTETFSPLTQHMSALLDSFAAALLVREEKKTGHFSPQIGELYLAALMDNTTKSDPPSTELADKLHSLINSENFPQEYREQLTDILNSISASPKNLWLAQYALEEVKSVIEPAEARAYKLISKNLPTTETIKRLTEELSDEFYIAKFIASFKSFKCIDEANQEKLAAIETQLTKLESHCSGCSGLQPLISEWRKELTHLEATAIADRTQDNFSKLGEQPTELKDSLERGAYFQTAKKTILNNLTNFQNKVKARLCRDGEDIQRLIGRTDNPPKQLLQLSEKHQTEQLQIEAWLENHIANYSKQQSLSEVLAVKKIISLEIKERYAPVKSELEAYHLAFAILKKATNDDFVKQINKATLAESTPFIKNITNKLFFFLRTEKSPQQHFLENLTQFLETEEALQNETSDPLLSFKQAFRNAITEQYLKNIKQPNRSLNKVDELFNREESFKALLLTPEAKDWFNAVKKAINAFKQCKLELDTKNNCYTPTFFLNKNDSKQKAISCLEERLTDLPLNTTQEKLEETFNKWEIEYGATIDKPRYRPILAKLMEIYHNIQALFNGKTFTTETRTLVNRIKEQTSVVLTTYADPSPSMRSL